MGLAMTTGVTTRRLATAAAIALALTGGAGIAFGEPPAVAPIDFDEPFMTQATARRAAAITDQYAGRGVTFTGAWAIDLKRIHESDYRHASADAADTAAETD